MLLFLANWLAANVKFDFSFKQHIGALSIDLFFLDLRLVSEKKRVKLLLIWKIIIPKNPNDEMARIESNKKIPKCYIQLLNETSREKKI